MSATDSDDNHEEHSASFTLTLTWDRSEIADISVKELKMAGAHAMIISAHRILNEIAGRVDAPWYRGTVAVKSQEPIIFNWESRL